MEPIKNEATPMVTLAEFIQWSPAESNIRKAVELLEARDNRSFNSLLSTYDPDGSGRKTDKYYPIIEAASEIDVVFAEVFPELPEYAVISGGNLTHEEVAKVLEAQYKRKTGHDFGILTENGNYNNIFFKTESMSVEDYYKRNGTSLEDGTDSRYYFVGRNCQEDFNILIKACDPADAERLAYEYGDESGLRGAWFTYPEEQVERYDCDYVIQDKMFDDARGEVEYPDEHWPQNRVDDDPSL